MKFKKFFVLCFTSWLVKKVRRPILFLLVGCLFIFIRNVLLYNTVNYLASIKFSIMFSSGFYLLLLKIMFYYD